MCQAVGNPHCANTERLEDLLDVQMVLVYHTPCVEAATRAYCKTMYWYLVLVSSIGI